MHTGRVTPQAGHGWQGLLPISLSASRDVGEPGILKGYREGSRSSCLPQFLCHTCPSPIPTLLIQDFRLHMAFLRFTASHSRRWPAGHKVTVTVTSLGRGPLQPHMLL